MSLLAHNEQHSLPYQTTSTQAFETTKKARDTLASGVGYGAPRHHRRPSTPKAIKRKKSSRFTICGCGGNVDLYDDGLNTNFHAGRGPGGKIIGQIRQAGSFIQTTPLPVPSIEYSTAEAHRRKRNKTGEQDFIPTSAPSPERSRVASTHRLSPGQTLSSRSGGTASPEAQGMKAIRAIPAETFLKRDDELASLRPDEIFSLPPLSIQHQRNASLDPWIDCKPASRSTLSTTTEVKRSAEQQDFPPALRQRRRGGFIGASASSIPLIDVEEASFVKEGTADALVPRRASVASTMSKYSVMSPCIDFGPNRTTLGGTAPQESDEMPHRNSLSRSERTLSVGTVYSLSASPAIGDVLSHFPCLPSMGDDQDDDKFSSPKRINTFGSDRRRDHYCKEEYGLDRINSFLYSDGTLALDLSRRPSSSCDSSPCSTPSTADSIQTESSGLSSKSEKRAAVMCRLPSHHDLAALSRCTDVGDLTWQEKLLRLSNGPSSSNQSEEISLCGEEPHANDCIDFTGDKTISQRCSKETIRSHKRGRGSSTSGAGPFSPPPNLPLPPVPSHRRTCPTLRSQKSLMSVAAHQHSSFQQPFFRATLPRSTTCPDLGDSGYAY